LIKSLSSSSSWRASEHPHGMKLHKLAGFTASVTKVTNTT